MSQKWGRIVRTCTGLCLLAALAGQVDALVPPERPDALRDKELQHPDLYIPNAYPRADRLPAAERAAAAQDLAALGVGAEQAYIDRRSGTWGSLMGSRPMLPGRGNDLTWEALGQTPPASTRALERTAWEAFAGYLEAHGRPLRIDPAEIAGGGTVTGAVRASPTCRRPGAPIRPRWPWARATGTVSSGSSIRRSAATAGIGRRSSTPTPASCFPSPTPTTTSPAPGRCPAASTR